MDDVIILDPASIVFIHHDAGATAAECCFMIDMQRRIFRTLYDASVAYFTVRLEFQNFKTVGVLK